MLVIALLMGTSVLEAKTSQKKSKTKTTQTSKLPKKSSAEIDNMLEEFDDAVCDIIDADADFGGFYMSALEKAGKCYTKLKPYYKQMTPKQKSRFKSLSRYLK